MSDENGMEVAPRPVPEDDLPFRPPVRVDLCSAVGTLLDPPDSVTYRGETVRVPKEAQSPSSCNLWQAGPAAKKETTRLRSPRDPVKGVGQLQQPGGSKLRATSSFSFERTHRAGGVPPAAVFAAVP